MKKFISFCLISLCFAFSMIFTGCEINTYTLEHNDFETIIAYGSDIDFSGLAITKNAGKDSESSIPVTPDMILSYDDTDSVGKKQAIIQYENQQFTLDFWVKYKVDFWVDDTLYDSQYVLSYEDLILIEPILSGYDFVSWDKPISQDITDNQTFNALFTVEGSGVPKLSTIRATYEDTLSMYSLPQNSKGFWKFVNPPTTPVGPAGTNEFEVMFVPEEEGLVPIYDTVTVNVAKKSIEFLDMQTTFDYDGTAKQPTYTLSIPEAQVEYTPYYQDEAIDSGEYEFELEVVDDNYKGSYYGSFCINKVNANVVIENKEIQITEDAPSVYAYSVKTTAGADMPQELLALMDISIVSPQYNHAGTYPITAIVNNTNFNVNVQNGYLTVQKVEHDLTDSNPVFTNGYYITYGSELSSMEFEESDVRGSWSFETESYKVLTTGSITVNVVFTPKEIADFLPSTKQIVLKVKQRVLQIAITQNEYTYDGLGHSINYSVQGVIDGDENSVVVNGNLNKITAGNYNTVLTIEDARYIASTNTQLIINKARLADFTTKYTREWNSSLLLQDIVLPERYTWEKPLTHITGIGEQTYVATYTPQDTTNYEVETSRFVVDIVKATASISILDGYTFEYSTEGYEINNIQPSHEENDLVYSYTQGETSVSGLTDAGVYLVIVSIPESEHYKAVSVTTIVTITKKQNDDVINNNISAIYGDLLSEFELPTSSFGIWQWQSPTTAVGTVGTQTHKAIFTPTNATNYATREVNITFIVDKKIIQIPTIDAKTFDGTLLTADIQDTDEYVVSQNNGGEEMGSYDVVLKLKDNVNCRWAGSSDVDEITTQFQILKNANNKWLDQPYIESFAYGSSTARYIATPAYGEVSVMFVEKTGNSYSLMRPTNVGDYYVRFVVVETDNYNGLETTLEFSITHKIATIPTINDIVYSGESVCADVVDTTAYTVEQNDEHTNVGEYVVKLKLVDGNYKWSDGSLVLDREIKYSIVKNMQNDWTDNGKPSIAGWTYTPTGGIPATAEALFGNVAITYKEKSSSSYVDTLPVNAGAYTARFFVQDTDNYCGLDKTIDFVITQAMPVLTAPSYDMTKVYYENNVDVEKVYKTAPSIGGDLAGSITFAKAILATQTITSSKNYEQVAFNITFTPTDTRNYQVATTPAYINLYKVAYIGDTYYGSIENAIAKAVSGDNVMVIPDTTGKVTIADDITINSGVSLSLPYINYYGEITINNGGIATVSSSTKVDDSVYCSGFSALKLTNKVIVKQDVIITNNGTIVIGGEISAGNTSAPKAEYADIYKINGIAGNTGRNYAKLVLESGAKIISKGTVSCCGYIDESSENNGSELIAEQGKVYMPFVIHDFRGGNYMYSAYTYAEGGIFNRKKIPITPYNQYEFRNIVPKFTIKYDATLVVYANLHAGDKINFTEGVVVGKTADAFIQFTTQNSYMVSKYEIFERPADGSDKWVEGVSHINIYGGAVSNSFSLKVKILTEITITTKDVFFPLSWRQDVILNSGDYTINYKFKLLPGAKLTVASDAIVNANELVVYEEFNDPINKGEHDIASSTQYNYGRTATPAELIVNGTLNVNSLGGKVKAGRDGAVVSVTNVSCNSYEVTGGENAMLGSTKIGWTITSVLITGSESYLQNGDNIIKLTSGKTYIAKNGTWE